MNSSQATRAARALRTVAAAMATSPPAALALTALERALTDRPGTLAVLTYHRVGARDGSCGYPGLVSATPDEFERQVALLARRFSPVSVDDVLEVARARAPLPRRAVLVTFDDAYVDFESVAWPVLRAHGVPAVVFVPTGFPDSGAAFWWDRLYHALRTTRRSTLELEPGRRLAVGGPAADGAFRALRPVLKDLEHGALLDRVAAIEGELGGDGATSSVLGWDRLVALRAAGVSLGAHSISHPLLTRVPPRAAIDEIQQSMADLQARTGAADPVFAYPSGAHDAGVVTAAMAAGVEVAFTTTSGVNDVRATDWLRVRRFNVGRGGLAAMRIAMLRGAGRASRTGGGPDRHS